MKIKSSPDLPSTDKPSSSTPTKPWWKRLFLPTLVTILLGAMAFQMLSAATIDGASSDEQIHILSGYTTLTQAHILFDPEHPFLAKALATIPLLFIHPHVPEVATHLTSRQAEVGYDTYSEANQWGYQMVFRSGNNADQLLFASRAVIALLTLGLALTIFLWTRSLWGSASALAALTIIAFEPSFIAHGHLANDDTVATLFFITTIAGFYHYLKKPTWKSIMLTGLSLGLGLITKYSLLLLGPTFIILLGLWILHQRRQTSPIIPPIFSKLRNGWQRYAMGLLTIFIIGWSVIWAAYGSLIIINPAQNPTTITNVTQVPPLVAKITPYIIPVMYAKGAAILFDPNSHGRDGYLLGACYRGGRWDYFPVLTLFKSPIPILLLLGLSCMWWWKKRHSLSFTPIVFIVTFGIYLAFCMSSNINIGFRHFLPPYALLLIIAAYPFSQVNWQKLVSSNKQPAISSATSLHTQIKDYFLRYWPISLVLALGCLVISMAHTYPNYLSYYNLLSGEPRSIPYITADSNTDWGQGTKQLQVYMQQHHLHNVAFDNFIGTGEAEYRHMSITSANPDNHNYQGYLALSRSTIIDHQCNQNDNWGWVTHHYQPLDIIGGSINLYKID